MSFAETGELSTLVTGILRGLVNSDRGL